jgi:hypothetical protein
VIASASTVVPPVLRIAASSIVAIVIAGRTQIVPTQLALMDHADGGFAFLARPDNVGSVASIRKHAVLMSWALLISISECDSGVGRLDVCREHW